MAKHITDEIADLCKGTNADPRAVHYHMQCSGLDFSECTQREFEAVVAVTIEEVLNGTAYTDGPTTEQQIIALYNGGSIEQAFDLIFDNRRLKGELEADDITADEMVERIIKRNQ